MLISPASSIYNTGPRKKKEDVWSVKFAKLEAKLDKACNTIEELKKENRTLKQENQALKNENTRLKSIIDNNSKNSSLPPSTDQKPSKAPNEYNDRKKTDRRPGGQPGRSGMTLTVKQVKEKIANKVFLHKTIADEQLYNKYLIDLGIDIVAYENTKGQREFVSYGPLLRSLIIDLYAEGAVSFERITSIINNLSRNKLNLSVGAVYGIVQQFANLCQNSLPNIEQDLLRHPVIYTDSTNISLNGAQTYIRNYSTARSVLYSPLDKKNLSTMQEEAILQKHTGTFVHDHETAMYHFGTRHGECNAHLMRYLQKNSEDTKNSWSNDLRTFLVGINQYKQTNLTDGIHSFTVEELARYSKRYDELLNLGLEQNKHTKPRYAWREERQLLTRLQKYKEPQLRFIYDFDVDFTNNISERDLRKCKTRQKISGGFRKISGKRNYCAIMSIIETCKRRKLNVFDSIMRIFAGEAVLGE